jgi:C4-dicarboxylate-specific signal transduction histidine kinase
MNLAARAVRLSLWIWDVSRNQVRVAQSRPNPGDMKEQIMTFDDVVAAVHPADRDTLRRAVRRARATGEEVDVEYRIVDEDGEVRWLAARGRAEQGESERLLGVALDITERKAAELREAEGQRTLRHMTRIATVGQLSAAISHQLNQPLAAILGNAETAQKMLGREPLDIEELREICGDIVNEDHRATKVIRRLGELYKRGDVHMESIDLNQLIRETLELLDTELLIRHVMVATNLEPALPPIEGGQVQLQQVILNLVLNAADAMSALEPEARRLTIRTESSGAEVRLYVEDNGPGIPADQLKTVFDPFWTTKPGGMGMGLAICQSIVTAHRGTITAINAVCGAMFCVTLPASRTS